MTMPSAIEEVQRLRLIRVSQSAGLPTREVLRLAACDLDALASCTDAECLAYARALLSRADLRAGRVPQRWTLAIRCIGCGPVWLWTDAPAVVIACPWCWNRIEGLRVPAAQGVL